MEDEETLKPGAIIRYTANFVQNLIDELLANSVVTTSVVVRSIFLASDHMLGVEEAAISAGTDLIDNIGFKIAVDCSWDIFALT